MQALLTFCLLFISSIKLNQYFMKPVFKPASIFLFAVSLTAAVHTHATAQDTKAEKTLKKDSAIKKAVETRHFTFTAESATPMGGSMRQLYTSYDLTIKGDTVKAYLPYFGRAYTAPYDPSEGGIQFTEVNPAYLITNRKNGGWDISIKTKSTQGVTQLALTAFENGSASLMVTNTNRQPISFEGHIAPVKTKE
jgi:Domain of unknown function (DUF4251)